MSNNTSKSDSTQLAQQIKMWGKALGFDQVGFAKPDLKLHDFYLTRWLKNGFQGEMHYMAKHGCKRSCPEKLLPNTFTVISVRLSYYSHTEQPKTLLTTKLQKTDHANIALYAQGRDYHKILRKKLQLLAQKIEAAVDGLGYRVFVDSAPVLERAIATQAGLGWIGKNTLLIHPQAGSLFFIGEIYTDLDLPSDQPSSPHCGSCQRCLTVCPTQAIVAPYQLDARLCIAYLTIEYKGVIPEELRPLIGNRIFGCDDCQLICPWNKFAKKTHLPQLQSIHDWDSQLLFDLFMMTEAEYLALTEGTALRRVGYECWLRNIAIGLGNTQIDKKLIPLLKDKLHSLSDFVKTHLNWALSKQIEQKSLN